MKRILIITVAGTSTRFSKSVGCETLKCIYSDARINQTILGELLAISGKLFDVVIVVGGYKFDDLNNFIQVGGYTNVQLVYNNHYSDWGSNYSLYLGLQQALTVVDCSEIVFAEGDLVLDRETFEYIAHCPKNILTSNKDAITADKSVAFYVGIDGAMKYIYDTKHKQLEIGEPFTTIANSGQVWKFTQCEKWKDILATQTMEDYKDTNLNLIQAYFEQSAKNYEIVCFNKWINCNTVEDYNMAFYGNKF